MKNFVFVSPEFPKSYYNFCDRLKKNGINVLGISSVPYEQLPSELKSCLTEYYKVEDRNNYNDFVKALGYFTYKYGKIDWLESNNENYIVTDAKLRKDFNITTGINSDYINNYRSKLEMKNFYRKARIPTLRYSMVTNLTKALSFIERVGYPITIKPDISTGICPSYTIYNEDELNNFFNNLPSNETYIMEELIISDVITYDGICDNDGNVLIESSHITPFNCNNCSSDVSYYTNIKVSNRLSAVGKKTIKAFNFKSRFFHLEFIKLRETKRGLGKCGRYVALKANMHPDSVYTPDMINYANSLDIYQLWADMIAYNELKHSFSGNKFYCVYASRRDSYSYIHNRDDILKTYKGYIVMNERIPEPLAPIMGNEMYTAKVETMKQLESFVDYVLEKSN